MDFCVLEKLRLSPTAVVPSIGGGGCDCKAVTGGNVLFQAGITEELSAASSNTQIQGSDANVRSNPGTEEKGGWYPKSRVHPIPIS